LQNLRKYGDPPYRAVVVHGGPGAIGSMAPIAKELSSVAGILEPLLTSKTINGQLEELLAIIKNFADIPVILAGHSWGAWLIYIFAAYHPQMVKKIILIGSGPFKEEYSRRITEARLARLDEQQRKRLSSFHKALSDPGVKNNKLYKELRNSGEGNKMLPNALNDHSEDKMLPNALNDPEERNKNQIFTNLGKFLSEADSFNQIPDKGSDYEARFDIYQSVWAEAKELRNSGKLIKLGKKISCPVIAIHGDYDPHPHEGVEKPLSAVVIDFRMILLINCGHEPWLEKLAKERFYEILKEELNK